MQAAHPSTPQDRILYPGRAWQHSHPDRMAVNAWLFGMDPAPVVDCRVLELGCGAGQNLIPMAYALPRARFLGVELAATPVSHGRPTIEALGLENVELRQLDIRAVTPELGEFDYIIAHGVYTWVPPEVREHVLRVFAENLAPRGVAYLNYNALPGGYIRGIVRDMMRYRLRAFAGPERDIPEAVRFVRAMIDLQPQGSAYAALLREELDRLERNSPDVVFHDDLAESNASVYLHEVLEAASRHGLQYLCEARLADVNPGRLPAAAQGMLAELGRDREIREQALDFLVCNKYRRTLLCRAGLAIAPTLGAGRMRALGIASNTRPESAPADPAEGVPVRFRGPEDLVMETDDAVVKSTLCLLNERWPGAIGFDELLAGVRKRLGGGVAPPSEEQFAGRVASGYAAGYLDLHTWEPPLVRAPGERPRASRLARHEIATQAWVTGLRHNAVHMDDPLSARILELLDGQRDRDALMRDLEAAFPGTSMSPDRLEALLARFAEFCLLES